MLISTCIYWGYVIICNNIVEYYNMGYKGYSLKGVL
jgi:hypothetical protein